MYQSIELGYYKITQSYLLHYYLDAGKYDAYKAEAESYFGDATNLNDQLAYIMQEGSKKDPIISAKYALYIYVRALYLCNMSELNNATWNKLKNSKKI